MLVSCSSHRMQPVRGQAADRSVCANEHHGTDDSYRYDDLRAGSPGQRNQKDDRRNCGYPTLERQREQNRCRHSNQTKP